MPGMDICGHSNAAYMSSGVSLQLLASFTNDKWRIVRWFSTAGWEGSTGVYLVNLGSRGLLTGLRDQLLRLGDRAHWDDGLNTWHGLLIRCLAHALDIVSPILALALLSLGFVTDGMMTAVE